MKIWMLWAAGICVATTGCHKSDSDRLDELEAAGRGPGPKGEQGERGERGDAGAPGEAGAPAAVSGARLKARWRVAEDGARSFAGMWDATLGVACDWELASDGVERCFPAVTWPAQDGQQFIGFGYSDAACTHVEINTVAFAGCMLTNGFSTQNSERDACDPLRRLPRRVFKIGAKTGTGVVKHDYYVIFNGDCIPAVTSNSPADIYDAEELPAISFVAGSFQVD